MKKILLLVLSVIGGLGFALEVKTSSSDQEMARELSMRAAALSGREAIEFAAAVELLSKLPESERITLIKGRSAAEIVAAAKSKSGEKFDQEMRMFRYLTPETSSGAADILKQAFAAADTERGCYGLRKSLDAAFDRVEIPVALQSAANIAREMKGERAAEFIVAMTIVSERKLSKIYEELLEDGPEKVVAEVKQTAPAKFEEMVRMVSGKSEAERLAMAMDFEKASNRIAVDLPKESGSGIDWFVDFAAAKKEAREEDRPLLLLFTGSDWCPFCIKLEKEFLATKKFEKYVDDELVMVFVDFPRRLRQSAEQASANRKLAADYKVEGFPTLIMLSPDGDRVLGQTGYQNDISVDQFIASLKAMAAKK